MVASELKPMRDVIHLDWFNYQKSLTEPTSLLLATVVTFAEASDHRLATVATFDKAREPPWAAVATLARA